MARILFAPSGILTSDVFSGGLRHDGHEVFLPNPGEYTVDGFFQRFLNIGGADLVVAFNYHYAIKVDVMNIARKIKEHSPKCRIILVVDMITETIESEAKELGIKIVSMHDTLWGVMPAINEALSS